MVCRIIFLFATFIFCLNTTNSQLEVPIDNYSVNGNGQVQLSIQAEADKYYILHAQHSPTFEWATSMTMGVDGTMVISEPSGAYSVDAYTITEHEISNPDDYDGDGIDDITEYNNMPTDAPINHAQSIPFIDGATSIPDAETFMELATINNVSWAPFLDDQLYVKFGILDRDTPEPKVYFINSNTHTIHAQFFSAINAEGVGPGKGEIVFNPNVINENGVIGSYSFNFSVGNAYNFEDTQRTYELLVASMPFLQNNMNHFIGASYENTYLIQYADQFDESTFDVVLESDVFADIDYIPFHESEGYGYFKHMTLDETPGSRDIVLYDVLPNSLPRVGGIITSVVQTPLSHVNLRAIQDNIPNAYIANPLLVDSIASLLNNYVHYKVDNEHFEIHEATLDQVNEWYDAIRPTEEQIPERDLSITQILPLDLIEFDMSAAFGAKCTNVATMRSFDLPSGTIPNGFGIPFYYYDEFMHFNDFYLEAQVMIENSAFQNDINFRIQRLEDFREDIKDAPMPQWMLEDLQAMHENFPPGTAVRCRSSTNNEDLPGFSGAGLYTSRTQHLDEGHISKSIKQVYASMWNFRAYEERDFYRVDHLMAAMGILCHPNFEEEKSNGVGISIDPIYGTQNTFYLNTQVGESLITNPDPNSVPEEILIFEDPEEGSGYLVLNLSNLVEQGELVMDQIYLDQMRDHLSTIHDEFAILYDVEGIEGFGMDIEYKVTAEDLLVIKQARPWVSFWSDIKADNDLDFAEFVSPSPSAELGSSEIVIANIANTGLNDMSDFELTLLVNDELIETLTIEETIEPFSSAEFEFTLPQDFSLIGDYNLTGIVTDEDDEYGNNDTLVFVLSKNHSLDADVYLSQINVLCDNEIQTNILFTNLGDETINAVEFEVFVNGESVGTFNEEVDISFQDQEMVLASFPNILQESDNEISVTLLSVNAEQDGEVMNNTSSATIDEDDESTFDEITLIITPDDWPSETTWAVFDQWGNIIAEGDINNSTDVFTEHICIDYDACYTLFVYDSWGDGICCAGGWGNFFVLNSSGYIIVDNDGDFGYEAQELICPSGGGCSITADINVTHSIDNDGSIAIYAYAGISPYQYSINGGDSFSNNNTFENLEPGEYEVVVKSDDNICLYEELVTIEYCTLTSVDIDVTHVTSAVVADGAIIFTPISGNPPYLYSIDGGQNFIENNEFYNLAVGTYNVIVMDASGACVFETTVPIDVTNVLDDLNQNLTTYVIKLYPNPTSDQINIEFSSLAEPLDEINVVVYDNWGRLIDTGSILGGSYGSNTLYLNEFVPGIYYVRCFNNSIEKYFKVVKI